MEPLFLTTFAVAVCCLIGWWRADKRLKRERRYRASSSLMTAVSAHRRHSV